MKFTHILADPDWWYNKRLNEQHGGGSCLDGRV